MDLFSVCSFRITKKEQNTRKRSLDKIFHVDSTIYISVSKQSPTGKEGVWMWRVQNTFLTNCFKKKKKLFSNDKEFKALSTNGAGIAGCSHAKG